MSGPTRSGAKLAQDEKEPTPDDFDLKTPGAWLPSGVSSLTALTPAGGGPDSARQLGDEGPTLRGHATG